MAKLSPFLNDYESILDQFTLTRANGDSLATDVYEQDGNVVIEAHIAGLDPEHVDISVEGNQLFIEGHREETDEQEDRDYYVKEVRYGSFERVVPLPAEVNLNKAEADYQNGILTITLPKVNGNSRKKIDVKAEKSTGKKASTKTKRSANKNNNKSTGSAKATKSASKTATNKNNNKATSTLKKATSKNNNSKSTSKTKSAKGSLSKNNNKKIAKKSASKNNNKATSTAKKATSKNNNSKSTSKTKSAKGSLSKNNNKKIAKKA